MAGVGQIKPLRDLSSRVRELTLKEIEKVLLNKDGDVDNEFRKAVILKLATNVLPRINEHSGTDGGPIEYTPIYAGRSIQGHSSDQADIRPEQAD